MDEVGTHRVVERVAARVILIDATGSTLLFRGGDPHRPEDGSWWFTPGGGVEDGESLEQAARREVAEETGVLLGDLGDPVWFRDVEFSFESTQYLQQEHFFVARVPRREPDPAGWTDVERRVVAGHRWWSLSELRSTAERVYPEQLVDLLAEALVRTPAGG